MNKEKLQRTHLIVSIVSSMFFATYIGIQLHKWFTEKKAEKEIAATP